jgi:hypothetical protein
MFLLVSLTLFTTLWLQFSLSTYELGLHNLGNFQRALARSIEHARRPRVAPDEFFKKPPPDQVVRDFFHFEEPAEVDLPTVQPLWKCHEDNRKGKLVYLHMYRSAGFTVRAILRAYANICHAGIALVSHCVDVGLGSMEGDEFWTNDGISSPRQGQECWLSYLENRTGQIYPIEESNAVSTTLVQSNEVDIFGGHLPVGALENWKEADDTSETDTDVRYITFFREPLQKYVSEYVFANTTDTNRTIDEIAEDIYVQAWQHLNAGKYMDKTSNHLISPEQKRWIDDERLEWTHERRVNLTMQNLVSFRVTVGLVDRLAESLGMLEYLIDGSGDLETMFRFFASSEKVDRVQGGSILQSRKHTARIVELIRSNHTRRTVLDEYLTYEHQIYGFASKLQHRQHALLHATKGAASAS